CECFVDGDAQCLGTWRSTTTRQFVSRGCVMLRFQFRLLVAVGCLCLFLGSASSLFSQAITGDILGSIQDSTGGRIPGAQVTLTAMDTGVTWTATSDEAGNYLFAQLKPGRYKVEASKQGFETATLSNIDL